jgi:KDO2-lipid IV(A) lauroyltransferase
MPRTSKTDNHVNKVPTASLRGFLAPRYWTTWIGIGLLILIAWLPHQIRLACGALLGRLIYRFGRERRYITAVNIRLCFPELSEPEQAVLVKRAFIDSGMGLIETATGWVRSSEHFKNMVVWKNPEMLLQARAEGRGVLILGAHYSTLDLGANLLAPFCPFAVTYRPHKNPLFDAFMYRGRLSNCEKVFDRYDIRGAFRHLKKGGVLWYAPDQDYGPEHAVYAPFFGNRAATITAPATCPSRRGSCRAAPGSGRR